MDNVKHYSTQFKQRSFSSRNVVVKHGGLPLIITAGHGGRDRPTNIPDRKQQGSVLLGDMHTAEIAQGIEKGVREHYRRSPYLILNSVSRRKLDVNRELEEGTETEEAASIWKEYHSSVQYAVNSLLKKHRYGLLIDIHGHTHPHGMIELGYLLQPDDLNSSPEKLDQALLKSSSIKSLIQRQVHRARPSQILLQTFGDSISAHGSVNVVPSSSNPVVVEDFYFKGGYTTKQYSEVNGARGLDAIQIEIPKEFRFQKESRQKIINILVQGIIVILDHHYYKINSKL